MSQKNKTVVIKPDIDYDQLANAIAKAINSSKNKEKSEESRDEEEQKRKWRSDLGHSTVEKAKNAKWIFKPFLYVWSVIVTIFRIVTFSRKNATTTKGNIAFIRLSTAAMFSFIRLILWIGMICFIGMPIYEKNYEHLKYSIPYAFLLFFFERIIRIAKLEIDNTDDKDTINMAFNTLVSLISLILAVVAIIVSI